MLEGDIAVELKNRNKMVEEDQITAATETRGTVHIGNLGVAGKAKLTERDLLKMCVDNPKYLSKALGHDTEQDGTGL